MSSCWSNACVVHMPKEAQGLPVWKPSCSTHSLLFMIKFIHRFIDNHVVNSHNSRWKFSFIHRWHIWLSIRKARNWRQSWGWIYPKPQWVSAHINSLEPIVHTYKLADWLEPIWESTIFLLCINYSIPWGRNQCSTCHLKFSNRKPFMFHLNPF